MSANLLVKPGIRRLIQATAKVYEQALDSPSISYEIPSEMRQKLEEDIFVFSGFKTYHQLKEASLLLRDDAGNIKPFSKFYQDVTKIKEKYNRNWLRAEYNFATASAEMASHWAEYATHKEYTNLQYHTALDDKVRESHAALEGITLPYEDPFWDTAFPPNGWNCRCHVVPVLKEDYPVSDSQTAQQSFEMLTEGSEIFRFNPGKEAVIFPPHHPYYGKHGYQHCINPHLALSFDGDPECKIFSEIHKSFKSAYRKIFPFKYKKRKVEELPNGTHLYEYNVKDEEKADQVRAVARVLMRLKGKDAVIMPRKEWGKMSRKAYEELFPDLIGTPYDGKTPDLRVGEKYYEVKSYTTKNGVRALNNMLKEALEQAPNIIIKRHADWTKRSISRAIHRKISAGKIIHEVWVQEGDGSLTLVFENTKG